jgi:5-methylcytosine-specific restriction endonuclease McrA
MFGFGKRHPATPSRGPGHRHASQEQRQQIYARDGGRCVYCGVALTRSAFVSDHVVAYSKHGGTVVSNLAVSCARCNMAKQAMPAQSFQRIIRKQGLKTRDQMAARHMTGSEAHQRPQRKKSRAGKQVGRAVRRQAVRSIFKLF